MTPTTSMPISSRYVSSSVLAHYCFIISPHVLMIISSVRAFTSASLDDRDTRLCFCLQGVSGSRTYIATQGPLPHTVVDFLRMIWEYGIKVQARRCLRTSASSIFHIRSVTDLIKKKKCIIFLCWSRCVVGISWFWLSRLSQGRGDGLPGVWDGKGRLVPCRQGSFLTCIACFHWPTSTLSISSVILFECVLNFFSPPSPPPPTTRKSVSAIGPRSLDSDLFVDPLPFIVWVLLVCLGWFQTRPQYAVNSLLLGVASYSGLGNWYQAVVVVVSPVAGFRGKQRRFPVKDFTGDFFQCRSSLITTWKSPVVISLQGSQR